MGRRSPEARNHAFALKGRNVSRIICILEDLYRDENGRGMHLDHSAKAKRTTGEFIEALKDYYGNNKGVPYDYSMTHDYRPMIKSFLLHRKIPLLTVHLFIEALRPDISYEYAYRSDIDQPNPRRTLIMSPFLDSWLEINSVSLMMDYLENVLSHNPVLGEHIGWITSSLYPWNNNFDRFFKERILKIIENSQYLSPELLGNLCYHNDRDIILAASENEACPEEARVAAALILANSPAITERFP